jgi:ElaB/YqjD/DUF883 family membrane-anchored ribosome-binding protein
MMSTELNARQGTVEGRTQKLLKDLKDVGDDVDGLLKEVAHSTAEGFAAVGPTIEGKLVEAKSVFDGARHAVTERARGSADATRVYVNENLWTSLGVAAVAGLVFGFLISRR